jgi:hypothetical protein
MVACQIDQRHATRSGVCLADLPCALAPVEPKQTHTDRREPAMPTQRSHSLCTVGALRLGYMVLAHRTHTAPELHTKAIQTSQGRSLAPGTHGMFGHVRSGPSHPRPPFPRRAPHRPSPGAVGILDYRARHRPSGSVQSAHLVRTVELVVHEARDDGGLADALISEEHQFILC